MIWHKKIKAVVSLLVIACVLISGIFGGLSYYNTPRVSADSNMISFQVFTNEQPQQLTDASIDYPPEATTDLRKLECVYSLLEQMRLEHNRVGQIALSDWKANQGKWAQYAKIFATKQLILLQEYNRLRDNIRKATYTDAQWKSFTNEQRRALIPTLYGDKESLKLKPTLATSATLDQLKAVDFASLNGQPVDPVQDFTAYTENDTAGHLTVTATKITTVNITVASQSAVYKKIATNYFGNFDHYYNLYTGLPSGTSGAGAFVGWAVNDGYFTELDMDTANNGIRATLYKGTTDYVIYFCDQTNDNDDTVAIVQNTLYYPEVARTGTAGTYKLYTDATRTTLSDTASITTGTQTYDYMVPVCGVEGSGTRLINNAYVKNLDLREPSLTNTPSSKGFGVIPPSTILYSTNVSRAWPVTANQCYLLIVNDGTIAINVTANISNALGTTNWTIGQANPSSNTLRYSLYKVSDNATDNKTLTGGASPTNLLTNLAASANTSVDIKLETGTFGDGNARTIKMTFTASAH